MLLANLKVEIDCTGYPGDMLPKDQGRDIAKLIGKELNDSFKTKMIAFFATTLESNCMNFIVEVIGTSQLIRIGGVNWNKLEKDIKKKVEVLDFIDLEGVGLHEITFAEAASTVLYCYKQDDYLIPDSDPHDVMGMENKYNDVPSMYHGRFLPMMKLYCDCVLPTNLLFTAGSIIDPVSGGVLSDKFQYRYQALEYKALLKKGIDKELKRLDKKTVDDTNRPFNRYYKALIVNRTQIHGMMINLVNGLKKNNMVVSNNYFVVDVMDLLFLAKNDKSIFIKVGMLLRELKGSTVVFLADIPNHFLLTTNSNKEEQSEHLRAEARRESDVEKNIDLDFDRRMTEYNILDTDDSLDFATKTVVIRDIINTIDESRKAEGKLEIIQELNKMVNNVCRNMAVVIAYTDTISYSNDYLFEQFKDFADNISISQTMLSPDILSDEILMDLGKASVCRHFMEYEYGTMNTTMKELQDSFEEELKDLIIDHSPSDPMFKSLYEFQFFIRESVDFRWRSDSEGLSYFSKLKKKLSSTRKKKLSDAKKKGKEELEQEEQRQGNTSSFSAMMGEALDHSTFGSFMNHDDDHSNTDETKSEIELDKMIGLTSIKEQIKDFTAFVQLGEIRKNRKLSPVPISKHMVFMGNPGTAKTTVARQLGRILHAKGLLPTANLHQVARDDLVGKYVGWTAKLCRDAIDKAKGGILFIDEAYSLTANEGGNNSYGQEAVDTFVNYMDKPDVRDETIIIFAGYKEPMRQFIASNPGLKSRIGFYLDFPDYSNEELLEIAKVQAAHHKYTLSDEYLAKLLATIKKERGAKDFANGRFVRSIFEKSVIKQSRRLMKMDNVKNLKDEEFSLILGEDYSTKGMDDGKTNKQMGFHMPFHIPTDGSILMEDENGNLIEVIPE